MEITPSKNRKCYEWWWSFHCYLYTGVLKVPRNMSCGYVGSILRINRGLGVPFGIPGWPIAKATGPTSRHFQWVVRETYVWLERKWKETVANFHHSLLNQSVCIQRPLSLSSSRGAIFLLWVSYTADLIVQFEIYNIYIQKNICSYICDTLCWSSMPLDASFSWNDHLPTRFTPPFWTPKRGPLGPVN